MGGMTPLMHAAKGSHLKCVTALLTARAMVNAEDEDAMRPLHFAAQSGDFDIATAIINAGAQCDVVDDTGRSVLEHLPDEVSKQPYELKRWRKLLGNESR